MRPASLRTVYPGPGGFDPQEIKREFPIFASNPGLVFLDSGASAQKPRSVIDRISDFYSTDYANVHRGVYRLSARSTELFEEARRMLIEAFAREAVELVEQAALREHLHARLVRRLATLEE